MIVPDLCIYFSRDKFKADEEEKELKKEQREKEKENTAIISEEERSKAVIPSGKYPPALFFLGVAIV